jgi:hypothetical protein
MVSYMPRLLYHREKDLSITGREKTEWASEQFWKLR